MNKAAFTVEDDIRRMQDEVFQLRLQHVVLVEGRDDKPFWARILEQVIPERFKIYANVNFPTQGTSGKSALMLHYLPYAGRNVIICLDSDFDYLLGNPQIQRPFVFQTYVYSVENFLCYAPSLAGILAAGTRTGQVLFNFEQFFSRYSEVMYNWLICRLHAIKNNQLDLETTPLPIFSETTNPENNLAELERQINDQIGASISVLEQTPGFEQFIGQLAHLGMLPQNAYLFIREHDLLDKITLKLLKRIANPIIEQEFAKLSNEERGEYFAYQRQNPFEKLLRQNTGFVTCPFYARIIEDVRAAFSD